MKDDFLDNFLIVALDCPDFLSAKKIIDSLEEEVNFYKIGSLFFNCGDQLIDYLRKKNKKIFLDLKFFDIPNTVKNICRQIQNLEIDFFTVHLLGGLEMLRYVREEIPQNSKTKIIGVSILTSFDESYTKDYLKSSYSLQDFIAHLFHKGELIVDGFVCSVSENHLIEGNNKIIINPGIRLDKNNNEDQKRVFTPLDAFNEKATHIVMGREVIQAKDTKAKVLQIKQSMVANQ